MMANQGFGRLAEQKPAKCTLGRRRCRCRRRRCRRCRRRTLKLFRTIEPGCNFRFKVEWKKKKT